MKKYLIFLFIFKTINLIQAHYHGQFKQDQFVNEHFFKNKRNGIFIDIGAFDGITHSNTYFFEKELEWTGICIEPIDDLFACLAKIRKCICLQGCIWDKTGPAKFLQVTYPDGKGHGFSGLVNTYDPRHMKLLEDKWIQGKNCKKEIVDVYCYKFNDICKKYNIVHIDYLSIDAEGAELDILQSIDFAHIDIDVIDVENNYNNKKLKTFLESKGFSFITRKKVDDIYRNKKYLICQNK